MLNLKESKIYKLLKYTYFSFLFCILKILGVNNHLFYLSKWIRDNGDNKLLINYSINSKSIVIDVGGYIGQFSDKIISLYNPSLIIFEPVKNYYNILTRKYFENKKVKIYNCGLSNSNNSTKIYISGDGTSIIKRSGKTESIKLLDVSAFIKKLNKIDLISINIEGAEYDVLERLIETDLVDKIKYIQVQFHSFATNSALRRKNIIKDILVTHNINFSYPYVWESFKLKD